MFLTYQEMIRTVPPHDKTRPPSKTFKVLTVSADQEHSRHIEDKKVRAVWVQAKSRVQTHPSGPPIFQLKISAPRFRVSDMARDTVSPPRQPRGEGTGTRLRHRTVSSARTHTRMARSFSRRSALLKANFEALNEKSKPKEYSSGNANGHCKLSERPWNQP